jgi:hypothetical protein
VTEEEFQDRLTTVLSKTATTAQRIAAMQSIAHLDSQAVFDAIVNVATEVDADEAFSRAAGECLAAIVIRRGKVGADEYELVPFYALTGPADDAYDAAVARYLRNQ